MSETTRTDSRAARAARMLTALPGWRVLRHYQPRDLGPDMLAGLVICLVLIPSTLAYAELAGSSPIGGIYAALAGTLGYFLFASSRHMNVGPDGAVALLAGMAILPLAGGDPAKSLIAGAWLALFTGAILILVAKLRLGIVASFLSAPVLLGYLNGAALVIVVSQWGNLFGLKVEESSFFLRIIEWASKLPDTHVMTLAVGVSVLILLMLTKRLVPRISPLVPVFFIALIGGFLIDFDAMGLKVIGEIREVAPEAVGLTLSFDDIGRLAIGALGLSMLIFPEGVLLGRAMAEKHDYKIDPDRELLALGTANLASGSLLGFAVGGSQTRTLLNSASGGRTQVANLASAVFLVAFLLFAAQSLVGLPKVAIAAILIYTGFGLIDVAGVREMWAKHRPSAALALGTSTAVVVIGVLPGILLGTFFAISALLANLARPHDALLRRRPGSSSLSDLGDEAEGEGIPGLVAYRFYGPLVFANIGVFMERLQELVERETHPVRQVLIDASAIHSIDFSAAEKLRPFLQELAARGIEVTIADSHLPLEQTSAAFGLDDLKSPGSEFDNLSDAVAAYEARRAEGDDGGGSPD